MDKLKMQSLDVVGSNIKKIQQLFPNCVTERLNKDGKPELAIDFEKLQAELSNEIIVEGEERYQFTWPDKRAANRLANTPTTMTLRPCREESVNFDHTQNLYIEGDNLDVLKALRETYLVKVKMIYIDPPYNTGNDFVYNDDFAQSRGEFEETSGLFDEEGNQTIDPMQRNTESNGRFHTDWLNMIYPRLKVARDLLSDDGVIFISIDDNEVENLRKICDEIFGSENHIETVVWKNKYGAGAKTVGFISAHEYILVYSKNTITDLTCEFIGEEREKYNKKDSKFNQRGPYRTQPLMTNSLGDRPNLMYSIFYNGVEIKPRKQWVWSKERMEEAIANDNVEFSLQKDGSYTVRSKSYLYDENGKIRRGKPVSVMNGPFTQDGTQEVRNLFDAKSVFDFTKPSELIKFFIGLEINGNNSRDYIILDFFSGSATTAHAVMQLNAEDGGNRKFIMVQLPEKTDEKSEAYKAGYPNICEIGKERIRRAGKKIKEDNKDKEGIEKLDIGFRVLKLDSSNMEDVYYTPQEFTMQSLFNENVKADRTGEDLLFQVMLDLGIELSAKIETQQIAGKTVYLVDDNYLVACFDRDVTEAAITEIAKLHPIYFVMRDASAANDNVIDNFEQLFEAYSKDTVRKIL
ncbi:site-specific DNA-methyltransferase [Phocaeicola coprocola]|uniref:site-specific DNA-methyltransferase n=1 Tax=Phocaeicola coprocola TaxID=310298 RepID=UPI0022E08294|nr:site-specific DNA-methyltransferase [Phocaeicola coprocola]